jgi:single stranded DNA-binding protein
MFSQIFLKRERKKMSNISIAGNVGTDLVLRYAKSGNAFVTVPVAVTTGRDDTKETHWFDVKCFGDLAERMAEVPKGSRVMFIGRMKQDKWESKEGEKRSKLCLYADEGGPSYRWHPKGARSDNVAKAAVETVQAAFAEDEEPF